MGLFKSSKNKVVINNTTVIRNGKVVSSDDPRAKKRLELEKQQEDLQKEMAHLLNMAGLGDFAKELYSTEIYSTEQPEQTKVVECKNCGANNTITFGKNVICEYCGTGLEY